MTSLDDSWVLIDFLAELHADREAGRDLPLGHYLARFPGHEEAVAREFLAVEGRGTPAPEEPAGADRIGPYRLEERIGVGGQGEVWSAWDTRLSRRVALKLLRRGLHTGRGSSRFLREAVLASKLEHPGICAVYETGEDDGTPYLAMRFVEGRSLAAALDASRGVAGRRHLVLDPPATTTGTGFTGASHTSLWSGARRELMEVVALVERAARALHVAHEAGIVHRDLKPANLMVTPEGEPVWLDFGLARDETGTEAPLTLTGEVFGTPAYMAPEQWAGEGRVDRRADLWSLGVILYEGLTLHRPFDGPTREALVRAITDRDPTHPHRHEPDLPRDLCAVLAVALEKDPDRRYQSALDLAEDLRRARMLEPVRVRAPGPLLRAGRWMRRNRLVTACLGAIFVLLAGALVLTEGQRAEQARLRELAESREGRLRELSRKVLYEYHESVRDLPGATALNRRMVTDMLAFLELLPEDGKGFERERVQARLGLGDVLGNPAYPNLGRVDEARRHYEDALGLCASVPDPAASATLRAEALLRLGDLDAAAGRLAAALERYHDALAALDGAGVATPLRGEVELHLVTARSRHVGDPAGWVDVLAAYEQGIARLEADLGATPAPAVADDLRWQLTRVLVGRGDVLGRLGRELEARAAMERALASFDDLPASRRTRLSVRLARGECLVGLSSLLEREGRNDEATRLQDEARRSFESILDLDPSNEGARGALVRARINEGLQAGLRGLRDRAVAAYREALALAEGAPSGLQQERIACHLYLGEERYTALHLAEARDEFARAEAIARRLLADGPDDRLALQQAAVAGLYLGKCAERLGERDEALARLAAARTAFGRLSTLEPGSLRHRRGMQSVAQSEGFLELSAGHHERALAAFEEAIRLEREHIGHGTTLTSRRSLGILAIPTAACLAGLGRDEDALAALAGAATELEAVVRERPEDQLATRNHVRACFEAARVEHRLGRRDAALDRCRGAVGRAEALLAEEGRQDEQLGLILAGALLLECRLCAERDEVDAAKEALRRCEARLAALPPAVRGQFEFAAELAALRAGLDG
ncbi:MAG: protein kinase [Planctomycetota bacterium]